MKSTKRTLGLLIASLLILTLLAAPLEALAAKKYSYTATTTSIKLSWNKITGATKYNILLDMASNPVTLKKNLTARSYTKNKLSPGIAYYFIIEGKLKRGVKQVSAGPLYTLCAAPKGLSAQAYDGGTVDLIWNFTQGADPYKVYMATSSKGPFKLKKTESSNKASISGLTPGKTYYFKVAAVNANKKLGPLSKAVSVKAK